MLSMNFRKSKTAQWAPATSKSPKFMDQGYIGLDSRNNIQKVDDSSGYFTSN